MYVVLFIYKIYYDCNQKAFQHHYSFKYNDNGSRSFTFKPNAVSNSTYNELQSKLEKTQDQLAVNQKELRIFQQAINKYKIEIRETTKQNREGSVTTYYAFYSHKVDSALLLLYAYRDRLKYDDKNQEWNIGGRISIKSSKDSADYSISTFSKDAIKTAIDSTSKSHPNQ